METGFELPEPSREAMEHSRRLEALIGARIDSAGGWIDFSEFMELALYAPALGYYSAGAAKFGWTGDFVTAPELSPLFAACIARCCVPLLRQIGEGVVLELGGGTGRLAAELLLSMERLGTVPSRYLMLEPSADLRERQRLTIAELAPAHAARITWLEHLPAEGVRGVILASEVADALPVSRFVIRSGTPRALGVGRAEDSFCWVERPADARLSTAVQAVQREQPLAQGYTSELSPHLPAWIASLADTLQAGVLLLADYGMSRREYYHPERSRGTLICHYRHRAHENPFCYVGLQDISAWVDFTAVAQSADRAGMQVAGYTTQAHFLLDAGIWPEMAARSADAVAAARVVEQARTLLLPGEMGERFKVMAMTRGGQFQMPGYALRDLRHML
jgi:SAM-dependent MidA family methyltransferase